jgi:hypothetical protein
MKPGAAAWVLLTQSQSGGVLVHKSIRLRKLPGITLQLDASGSEFAPFCRGTTKANGWLYKLATSDSAHPLIEFCRLTVSGAGGEYLANTRRNTYAVKYANR